MLRRPLLAAVLSAGFLAVLAIPTLGMHTALPGIESLPRDVEAMQTYDRIQAQFPAESLTAVVVVEAGDVEAAPVRAAIAELGDAAAAQPGLFEGPAEVEVSPDESVAAVALPIAGNGSNGPSNRALDALREEIVPATVGEVEGVEAGVTGPTASIRDFNDTMTSHLPYVFGFVLIAAFLLLLVTFRSLVIPIKAIVLNLLSVAASYGVLVWLFQSGHGESLLGFESTGAITAWLPLFMFVILFGLSMDYHVLILSRIRELHDGGMSTRQAVAEGVKDTAGVVTTAALVMVGVFAMFATVSNVELKQMGVGLAVAVLLDATIVRAVLLPATMSLLGERNWWLPRRLGRLSKPTVKADGGEVEPARA